MSKATKQMLLDITMNLINDRGVDAVSMRRIGRHAGLSRTAVYRHFNNKEALLAAVVEEQFIALLETMTESPRKTSGMLDLLAEMLKAYFSFAMNNRAFYHLMFSMDWDKKKFPQITQAAQKVFAGAAGCVDSAMQQHTAKNRTVKETTAMIYAFIHGLVCLHLAGHKEPEKGLDKPEKLIHQFINDMFQ